MAYTYDIEIGDELLESKEVPVEFGISEQPTPDGKYVVIHKGSGFTFKVSSKDADKLRTIADSHGDDVKDTLEAGVDWG